MYWVYEYYSNVVLLSIIAVIASSYKENEEVTVTVRVKEVVDSAVEDVLMDMFEVGVNL